MAGKSKNLVVSTPLGIHELELSLIREFAAWQDWDLDKAALELKFMKNISKTVEWMDDYLPLVDALNASIRETERTVKAKDSTLITAAHTRLEKTVFELRDMLYK